jgi:hypothetical protein
MLFLSKDYSLLSAGGFCRSGLVSEPQGQKPQGQLTGSKKVNSLLLRRTCLYEKILSAAREDRERLKR